jgi:hypothetical protein
MLPPEFVFFAVAFGLAALAPVILFGVLVLACFRHTRKLARQTFTYGVISGIAIALVWYGATAMFYGLDPADWSYALVGFGAGFSIAAVLAGLYQLVIMRRALSNSTMERDARKSSARASL